MRSALRSLAGEALRQHPPACAPHRRRPGSAPETAVPCQARACDATNDRGRIYSTARPRASLPLACPHCRECVPAPTIRASGSLQQPITGPLPEREESAAGTIQSWSGSVQVQPAESVQSASSVSGQSGRQAGGVSSMSFDGRPGGRVPPEGRAGDCQDSAALPPGNEVVAEGVGGPDDLAVTLAAGEPFVDVPGWLSGDVGEWASVGITVVAVVQPLVLIERGGPSRNAIRAVWTARCGSETKAAAKPWPGRRAPSSRAWRRPSSESSSASRPVAMPASLSAVVECVS
ncbi:hypothetical protein CFP65_0811 [Kitasatospora sp. MMS16-BH015]|nr:hypothetical protein CFP65_0811 [Kitasatospora sp. MMS16-BH015]